MKSYYCPFRGERTPLNPCVSAWWAQKSGHSRDVYPSAVPNQNGGNSLFKSLKRSAKGANVPHAKATAELATVKMPTPEHVIIPMSMHIGAPAEPVVKKGDTVMVGTLIGKAGGFVSASIYSSVSGTVQDVAPMRMVNGSMTTAVAIKTDGEQTIDPACVPPTVTDKPSLMAAVQNCGLVGVGGAGFPAHVKLAANTIDTLLINAAECEPYLTTDCREMLECSDTIIFGIEAVMKYCEIPHCIIGIERNKPECIDLLCSLVRNMKAISRPILVKTLARAPSVFSFLRLILFHLLCPDMDTFPLSLYSLGALAGPSDEAAPHDPALPILPIRYYSTPLRAFQALIAGCAGLWGSGF